MNYKNILSWLLNIQNKEITQDVIDSGLDLINSEMQPYFNKKNKNIRSYFNKKYISFFNNDFKKHHKKDNFNINDINANVRKLLEKRIITSLNNIKIKDKKLLLEIQNRFINFLVNNDNKNKTLKDLKDNLRVNECLTQSKNYTKNILRDQMHRFNDSIDYTMGTLNGAVGLVWHTQQDKRVVGDPTGLYPKGNTLHNNHFKRDGVFFSLKDSIATKNKLVNAEIFETLTDIKECGRPINCRCYYEYIYDLRDVPTQYLTKKGFNFIKKNN